MDNITANGKRFLFRFIIVFVTLFILTLSFPHPFIPDIPSWIAPLFEPVIQWTGATIFRIKQPYTSELISDSTGLYIHLFVLVVIGTIIACVWSIVDRNKKSYRIQAYWFISFISYYLAFYLLSYGCNKLFKWQFYLPEPNLLFTTVGNMYRDMLYWSSMGTSHSYNVFLGLAEIIAAILLLFRRTRLVGALFAFGIMVNVVMINFSFNISVKIYSCFLLLLSAIIIAPNIKRLYSFFINNNADKQENWKPVYSIRRTKWLYITLKSVILIWMISSILSEYIRSGHFNDDKAERIAFHGSYEIPVFVSNGDTLLPLTTDNLRWRRLFIHRDGYLIAQSMNDDMQDYLFESDTLHHTWTIQREDDGGIAVFDYRQPDDNTILLSGTINGDSLFMQLDKIDLEQLPVMQKEFNWTIDY
jgi:hypothetical protein